MLVPVLPEEETALDRRTLMDSSSVANFREKLEKLGFWCCGRAKAVLPCACEDVNGETSRSAICGNLPGCGGAQGA